MTSTKSKPGRKPKNYITSDGRQIDGLCKLKDGRWRIRETRKIFTEPDEQLAVARFYRTTQGRGLAKLSFPLADVLPTAKLAKTVDTDPAKEAGNFTAGLSAAMNAGVPLSMVGFTSQTAPAGWLVELNAPESLVWSWVRQQLINRPQYVAQQVGIEQIGYLSDIPKPQLSLSLAKLWTLYDTHGAASPVVKLKMKTSWELFAELTGATVLRDLNHTVLLRYADTIKTRFAPDTIKTNYQRVKTIIGFGLQRGLDTEQIRKALDLCAILRNPKGSGEADPRPISKADFQALLEAAKDDELHTAALLLSLNACMYISEIMSITWEQIDWEEGTLNVKRQKTGIPRAAVLWTETLEALKKLKKTPGAIFKSSRGAAYHPNSYRKLFAALCVKAKVPHVDHNQLRDGAYTAAAKAKHLDPFAPEVLAGHSCGMKDKYVLRDAEMVRSACEAVYNRYMK